MHIGKHGVFLKKMNIFNCESAMLNDIIPPAPEFWTGILFFLQKIH